MKTTLVAVTLMLLSGCSVFGQSDTATAPYTVIEEAANSQIEVREYAPMILVSTPMKGDDDGAAFRRLFNYISGDNVQSQEIAMTAPVFTSNADESESGQKIAMTAPVLMSDHQDSMTFIMPDDFTLATTPRPTHPDVSVSELTNYKVAAIQFSGTLSDRNVEEHTQQLRQWLAARGYQALSKPVQAAYNGPMTLPFFRRNEILIEVQ